MVLEPNLVERIHPFTRESLTSSFDRHFFTNAHTLSRTRTRNKKHRPYVTMYK
jgi:hypothetical protein